MVKIHLVNRSVRPSSLDLNLLIVFNAIVKDRNVTLAARRVGLALPVGMRGRKSQWAAKVNPHTT